MSERDLHNESDAPAAAKTKEFVDASEREVDHDKHDHAGRGDDRMPDHGRQVFPVPHEGHPIQDGLDSHDERVVDDCIQQRESDRQKE